MITYFLIKVDELLILSFVKKSDNYFGSCSQLMDCSAVI